MTNEQLKNKRWCKLVTDKVWGHGHIEVRFSYYNCDHPGWEYDLHCVRIMCFTREYACKVLRAYRAALMAPLPKTPDGSIEMACQALRNRPKKFTVRWLACRPCLIEVNDPDNYRVPFLTREPHCMASKFQRRIHKKISCNFNCQISLPF